MSYTAAGFVASWNLVIAGPRLVTVAQFGLLTAGRVSSRGLDASSHNRHDCIEGAIGV